jgi:hypothetical protein
MADQDLRQAQKAAAASCLAGPRIIFPLFRVPKPPDRTAVLRTGAGRQKKPACGSGCHAHGGVSMFWASKKTWLRERSHGTRPVSSSGEVVISG